MSAIQHSSFRRTTISSRQRENRPTTPGSGSSHRRKSRSPDPRPADESSMRVDSSSSRKKKKQSRMGPPSHSSSGPGTSHHAGTRPSRLSAHQDETASDRGSLPSRRKSQPSVSEDVEMHIPRDPPQPGRRRTKAGRRERSQSRDAIQRLVHKMSTPEPTDDAEEEEERHYTGPLAAADYLRIKEELEKLKKRYSAANKNLTKQSKVIDGLRQDLSSTQKAHEEQSKHVEKLRSQAKKSDEVISSIESNLNCQICLEMLMKPFGLSPCGHVLCLKCLQEWFRAAPPGADEMYDEDMPEELIYRKKTCPVCRTVVLSRPIPLFLVKSIAAAFEKSRRSPTASARPSPPPDGDVWAGIFVDPALSDDEGGYSDGDDAHVHEESEDDGFRFEDEDDEDEDGWPFEGYGSDDDEPGGIYVHPRWAPPTVYVSPEDYQYEDITDEQLSMLRRGASLQMIELFSMTYSHEEGLKAVIDGNELFLGWNIDLNDEDPSGEEYMDWLSADVFERPDRWERHDTAGDGFMAWRLVREDEEEDAYETTDSEAWAADLTIDEDEF